MARIEMLRLRRGLGRIARGVLILPLLALLIVLVPILLPAAMAAEALALRRLARTRCVACGAAIGLAEIRRARREARALGQRQVSAALAIGYRPRLTTAWAVRCPTCGQTYEYRPDTVRPELVVKAS